MISIGVDTGADGAIGIIERNISGIAKWTTHKFTPCRTGRGLDGIETGNLISGLPPGADVWIENNTARPAEVPDFAMRHGINLGQLKQAFHDFGFNVHFVSPSEWTGRLGIRGKTEDSDCRGRAKYLCEQYPGIEKVIYGPRGGVAKGEVDALLIAHYGMLALQAGAPFGGGAANVKKWVRRSARGLY